ncbi:hypothetical protein MYX76_15360 [Desulfobacterota bacterium AH_259_B03_O07]|nr:hypothetical protein [Desulfobacterota bacterium AH_259_B03_O07]
MTPNINVADTFNDRIQVFTGDEVMLDGTDGTISGGGCSVASVGSAHVFPLYLLLPVLIILRRVWKIY